MATWDSSPAAVADRSADPFVQGWLDTDFAWPAFTSAGVALGQAWRAFWKDFPTLALLTLAVFGPAHVLKNYWIYSSGLQADLGVVLRANVIVDAVLGSLLAPAVIFALMWRFRTGQEPDIKRALRWGVRMWGRTFGYRLVAGLCMVAGLVLLVVPGIIVAVMLSLVTAVVSVEADRSSGNPLQRSRELTRGYRWRIFGAGVAAFALFVMASMMIGVGHGIISLWGDSWMLAAAIACLTNILATFFDALLLCIYLGIVAVKKAAPLPPESPGFAFAPAAASEQAEKPLFPTGPQGTEQ